MPMKYGTTTKMGEGAGAGDGEYLIGLILYCSLWRVMLSSSFVCVYICISGRGHNGSPLNFSLNPIYNFVW
jgi:hypothetical protein